MQKIKNTAISFLIRIRKFFRGGKPVLRKVGNFELWMDIDHALPRYLSERPSYSSNLPRIAKTLKSTYQNLKIIDVGANVGDSVALIRSEVSTPILCVEGDQSFSSLLKKNLIKFSGVELAEVFLGDKKEVSRVGITKDLGTLKIENNKSEKELSIITLDELLQQKKNFYDAKLLKIDTDGYDSKILRGAVLFIRESRPVIFFELDRFLLKGAGENGLEIFDLLKDVGYEKVLFYDNVGRFILAEEISQTEVIKQLYFYTYRKRGAFPYYDVAVFHRDDNAVAKAVIKQEEEINENIV